MTEPMFTADVVNPAASELSTPEYLSNVTWTIVPAGREAPVLFVQTTWESIVRLPLLLIAPSTNRICSFAPIGSRAMKANPCWFPMPLLKLSKL